MNLAKLFGLPSGDKADDAASIGVTVGKVTLPLDIMVELVLRQQGQLFSEINNLQGLISVGEQVTSNMAEHYAHLHDDVVQLQQNLQQAVKHPIERLDEQREQEEKPPEKEKIH